MSLVKITLAKDGIRWDEVYEFELDCPVDAVTQALTEKVWLVMDHKIIVRTADVVNVEIMNE